MPIYVVRHACAGRKSEWSGDDAERPLDEVGVRQAEALAGVLVDVPMRRLLSSPTRRCLDTLEPLARRTGLTLATSAALDVDTTTDDVVELLRGADADQAVLCTHGEVMGGVLDWLIGQGVVIEATDLRRERLLAKGTAWSVELGDAGRQLRPALRHLAPMPLLDCATHRKE